MPTDYAAIMLEIQKKLIDFYTNNSFPDGNKKAPSSKSPYLKHPKKCLQPMIETMVFLRITILLNTLVETYFQI